MVEHQHGNRQTVNGASARSNHERPMDDTGLQWFGRALVKSSVSITKRVSNMLRVVCSNQALLTKKLTIPKVSWNESIGLHECPYLRRWVVDFGAFALRLHRWQGSDDTRAFHDHSWNFITCVLRGSYVDISPDGRDTLTMGSIRYRPATHRHTVQILQPGTWTILLTGPVTRRWGFWVNNKLWKRDRYFAVNGHHPCSDSKTPKRLRPDGSEIL